MAGHRERAKNEEMARLRAEAADWQRRALEAEAEAEELREQAPAAYVVRTASGAVLHEGDDQALAVAVARQHFQRSAEHVAVEGAGWASRTHGFVRMADGRYLPDPVRVREVNR